MKSTISCWLEGSVGCVWYGYKKEHFRWRTINENSYVRRDDGGKIFGDSAGAIQARSDINYIRNYTKESSNEYSRDSILSERALQSKESERLIQIAKNNRQFYSQNLYFEFGEKKSKQFG